VEFDRKKLSIIITMNQKTTRYRSISSSTCSSTFIFIFLPVVKQNTQNTMICLGNVDQHIRTDAKFFHCNGTESHDDDDTFVAAAMVSSMQIRYSFSVSSSISARPESLVMKMSSASIEERTCSGPMKKSRRSLVRPN